MKITVVNGQSHKGSTYHIGKMLADKLGGKVTEFFLPKDFSDMCIGCTSCFIKNEHLCPHHTRLEKLTNAIDDADVLIFTSPVYVYHTTGAMKSFLDHYGYRWMVHRPEKKMFSKQAVCISTAAGAGTKSTNKDIADSFFFWGIPKIYKYGVNVRAGKIEKYRAEGADIIFTLDTHHCDYLTTFEGRILPIEHCIEYTKGHELYGKIKSMVQPNDKVFKKCTYGSEALFDYLRKCDYKEIELCGLVSNICVISNAVLARTALPNARLTVDSNATASNDDGLNTAALNVMRGLGITVI